jgi:hypothetical protein
MGWGQAVYEQNLLGWDQWFSGRITIEWGKSFNHDLSINKNSKVLSAEKWGKDVLSLTLEFTLNSWFAKNNKEHESETNPQRRIKEKLIEKIM